MWEEYVCRWDSGFKGFETYLIMFDVFEEWKIGMFGKKLERKLRLDYVKFWGYGRGFGFYLE